MKQYTYRMRHKT